MSARQYKQGSIYGNRHIRKKTRRVPPSPAKRQSLERRSDEDYANIGHRHKLTYLRYPGGSGKRAPPKPRRLHVLQEVVGSPPPNAPVAAPRKRTPPTVPKPTPYAMSPLQELEDGWVKVELPPTSTAPPRPLLPPKLPNKKSSREDTPNSAPKRVTDKKRPPPKPRAKPPPSADPAPSADPNDLDDVEVSSLDILGAIKKTQVRLNSVVKDPRAVNDRFHERSLPIMPLAQVNKPAKQPLLPPSVKPRKPRLEKRKQESDSDLDIQSSSLQLKNSALLSSPTTPQRRPLAPPSPTNPQRKQLVPQQERLPPPSIPPVSPQRKRVAPPTTKPPAPPPHSPTSPPGRSNSVSESVRHGSTGKAPLPKPRQRKGDNIDAISSSQTHQDPAERGTEGVATSRIHPVARTKLAAVLVRRELSRDEEMLNSSPVHLTTTTRPTSCDKTASLQVYNGGQQKENVDVGRGRGPMKTPPVPRKRASKEALEQSRVQPEAKKPPMSAPAPRQVSHKPSLRTRKKGGGIRMPLWIAPPPPSWTPPPTPNQFDTRHDWKRVQPLLPLAELTATPLSPPPTPTGTTSFILPPFHSSDLPSSSSSDFERSLALDQESPVLFTSRPTCTSPTPKSPAFEEKLFKLKTPKGQQQLPINVVQELQGNLWKQITRRSGMA